MSNEHAVPGGMLVQFAELGVIEFCSEPLDAIVERRLKTIWTSQACPSCGDADALRALDGSTRIWCGRCDWKTTYTRGTPFYDSELAPGKFLVAFVLYAALLKTTHGVGIIRYWFEEMKPESRIWQSSSSASLRRHYA